MTKLMLRSHPEYERRLFVSDWEIAQGQTSYTYLTLEHLKVHCDRIIMLIGTDMLLTLHQWREPAKICRLSTLAFMPREPLTPALEQETAKHCKYLAEAYGAEIQTLRAKPLECSSTELRDMLKKGDPAAREMLCPDVYDYIEQNHLYGS